MISTLSKQGGRRYPQMGSTGLAFHGWLPSVGETAAAASVDTGGVRRRRNRQQELAEREEAEIKMILQQIIPVIERGRRGKH